MPAITDKTGELRYRHRCDLIAEQHFNFAHSFSQVPHFIHDLSNLRCRVFPQLDKTARAGDGIFHYVILFQNSFYLLL